MPKVSILTPGGGRVEIENGDAETVATLTARVSAELGLAQGLTPAVNGAPATPETPVRAGDEVAFTKPVGQKG